jgi:hypothetical protein
MEREAQVRPGADGRTDRSVGVARTTGAGSDAELEGHELLERWSDREEVHALPEILRPAEGLVAVGSGTVVKSARLAQSNWLVVLTDRRLLCLKGRAAVGRKVVDMPASQIRSVETSGLFRKTLSLETDFGTLRVGSLTKSFAKELVEGLTAVMGAFSDTPGGAGALPNAELATPDRSKAGPPGDSREAAHALEDAVGALEEKVEELTDRVAFLEELVRSNVATQPDPTEVK